MKAAYIKETGTPEKIIVGELPMPKLKPEQVLVKVTAVAVDPIDTYIRAGTYKIDLPFPFIIGRDMVGTVTEVGANVNGFHPGSLVWCNNQGYAGRQGTFAEYVAIDEDLLYSIPEKVDALNVVASVHSALTSVVGLIGKAKLAKGETLFINGGSGNVGQCAIQLAKHLGAKVAVTAGSTEKVEWCRQSGADFVINYKTENVAEQLSKYAPDGVDVYWELTQRPDLQAAVSLVARRGRILLSSGMQHTSEMTIGAFYTHNLTMYGFTITELNVSELQHYAAQLNQLFQQNVFQSRISKTMKLDEAAEAHRLIESGTIEGKIVLR